MTSEVFRDLGGLSANSIYNATSEVFRDLGGLSANSICIKQK